MDMAIFSSTRTATPFSAPVWIILTPSLVKSLSSFHLVSASPITSKFALFISLKTLVSFPGLRMVRSFHVPTWILFFRSFFFFWFLLIWQEFRWMTTEEAPPPPLPDATLPGIQIESFTSLAFFFNCFMKHIPGIYREVVSQVLPLSVFHETPSLALTSSVIRPSGSSPQGLAYTGEDSVVHHDLCVQQGDLVKVVWWALEQQRRFETLATPFSHPIEMHSSYC